MTQVGDRISFEEWTGDGYNPTITHYHGKVVEEQRTPIGPPNYFLIDFIVLADDGTQHTVQVNEGFDYREEDPDGCEWCDLMRVQ